MIYPVPKPAKRGPKERAPKGLRKNREPMKRTRMKQVNRKRGGSSFPKQRDPEYRRWIRTENPCLMLGRELRRLISLNDIGRGPYGGDGVIHFEHRCYGEIEPAHVGEHQAQGAPDFGVIVPLCHAAHRYYDEHRSDWKHVTRFTEKGMALAASGYAQKYVERGGTPEPR